MRIGGFIGKHKTVGGARDHVDADTAKQDTLGFGDKLVAGADKNVGFWQAKQAKCHRRDALHAAQRHDLVSTANMRGIDDRRGHADTGARRRGRGDVLTARNLGRGHGHDRAGDVAIPATRDIAACRIHRDRLLPCDQTRDDFVFDVC